MISKILVTIIIMLVVNLAFVPYTYASNNPEKEAKLAKKVKTEIAKLGVGREAKIKVKLKDGTKLKGYVAEINEDSFVITNEKTGVATTLSYSQPKQVKGNNLTKGTIIVIGFVAFIIIISLVVASSAK